MSFGGSDAHSTETLDYGLAALKRQQVKQEDPRSREDMERELEDRNSRYIEATMFHKVFTPYVCYEPFSFSGLGGFTWAVATTKELVF